MLNLCVTKRYNPQRPTNWTATGKNATGAATWPKYARTAKPSTMYGQNSDCLKERRPTGCSSQTYEVENWKKMKMKKKNHRRIEW